MTVGELKAKLDDYGDHVEVRVGFSGEPAKITGALHEDRARVLDVDYVDLDDQGVVLLNITA